MKKLLVAAAVLLAAGAAVAGAVHVKSSLDQGLCPLTGKPIACRGASRQAPSAAASHVAPTSSAPAGFAAMGDDAAPASQTLASDECESACPTERRRHCCPSQRAKCEPKQVETPAAPSPQNP